ncbi:MAG: M15 family metallopeptidase [Desulfovibrionales bacterium]|nr:M15 family metallopeptidase [Desulfovibrionales bacterium]
MLYDDVSKIPPMKVPSWDDVYSIQINEEGEDIVSLSELGDLISIQPTYWLAGIEGSFPGCYVRASVLQKLEEASRLLPDGLRLMVLDGWRSQTTQRSLFNDCYSVLRKQHPELEQSVVTQRAKQFVALPSENATRPSPHSTGGAVDLMIVDNNDQQLFFGAPFDFPGDISTTRYYEELLEKGEMLDAQNEQAMYNRRLLYDVMIAAGFVNYHNEWWHFEYKTQRWAYMLSKPEAYYGQKDCKQQPLDSRLSSFM